MWKYLVFFVFAMFLQHFWEGAHVDEHEMFIGSLQNEPIIANSDEENESDNS